MHRKTKPNQGRRLIVLVTSSALAVIIVACLIIIFAGGNNGNQVVQPASAQAVASQLKCGNFKEGGRGMLSGLGIRLYASDSGTCTVDGKGYTIYTFADQDVRDTYIQAAAGIGVSPTWETDNAVAIAGSYPY